MTSTQRISTLAMCILALINISADASVISTASVQTLKLIKSYCTPKTAIVLGAALAGHLTWKYIDRPSDEELSEEFLAELWAEKKASSGTNKARLLAYYLRLVVIGRRSKVVDATCIGINKNGDEYKYKDKKVIISGSGPIAFVYDNIFANLEDALKLGGTIAATIAAIEYAHILGNPTA